MFQNVFNLQSIIYRSTLALTDRTSIEIIAGRYIRCWMQWRSLQAYISAVGCNRDHCRQVYQLLDAMENIA